jgi:TolB-like protein
VKVCERLRLAICEHHRSRCALEEEQRRPARAFAVPGRATLRYLYKNISMLRKALGESGEQNQYIETIPWRGYRFRASVKEVREEDADLIVEERSSSQVVIDKEINALTAHFVIGPSAIEKVPGPVSEVRGKRKPTLAVLAACAALILAATAIYLSLARSDSKGAPTGIAIRSIAVLPFRSLGPQADDEYLQLGLADTLITRLSNIRQIIVRPTSVVMKYSGQQQDPLVAGRELGVEAVLEGHIQKSGDRVRVTVQLVRVNDGSPVWAGKFEEKLTNIFRVQDSICEPIAEELSLKLTGEERERLTRRDTENPEAYQAYMKGRLLWNKRYGKALRMAIDHFNQAIELDANYALAYAGLADCYVAISAYAAASPKDAYPKAKEAAEKALEIDNQLAEALTSLAHIAWLYDWDWPEAERKFKQAIDLNPNYATAHQWYAVYLSSQERHEEALTEARRAQEIDPTSIPISEDLARVFYHARRFDEAISAGLKTRELEPNYYRVNSWLCMAYEQKGLYDQAIEDRLKAMSLVGVKPEEMEAGRTAYRDSGWPGYWRKELELTKKRAQHIYILPYNVARICARLGVKDEAFAWLEKAYEERSEHLTMLKVDPLLDSLRPDPRFANLVRRVGLER